MKNIKWILTVCVISTFFAFQVSAAATTTKAFSDIDAGNPNFKAVDVFRADGMIDGYPDGTFKPNQAINRAEALKIILKAFGKSTTNLPENKFKDVDAKAWYFDAIRVGLRDKIVEGYKDETFKPANQVTFAESLKMAIVAKDIKLDTVTYKDFHPSVKSTDWFAKYFSYGYSKNLFDLEKNGSLNPIEPMTRGRFVELIYRVKNYSADGTFDIAYNFEPEIAKESGIEVAKPIEWESYKLGNGLLFGYFDGKNPNFLIDQPNSARVEIVTWENPTSKTASAYFADLKVSYGSSTAEFSESVSGSGPSLLVTMNSLNRMDYYVYLKDKRILACHAVYDGKSLKKSDFIKQINAIYDNAGISKDASFESVNTKLESVRANILAPNKGLRTIELFDDKSLFETDTLGVGTGPVDYYYSATANYTFKYERSSDVILDIQEGKTSAF